MADSGLHPAVARLLRSPQNRDALQVLSDQLSGTDLTSLLLEAFRRRSSHISSSEVLRQYQRDRFVGSSPVDALALARIEYLALEASQPEFEPVRLAPLAPFGTHAALGDTPQNNVVTTARLTEVAADPTNQLALEAALRRRQLRATEHRASHVVSLSATSRVVRAQRFHGPRSFAHFTLFGLVSAGRDDGALRFEKEQTAHHLRTLAAAVRAATGGEVALQISPFEHAADSLAEELCGELAGEHVVCEIDSARQHGRGYYRTICYKVFARVGDDDIEVGDGGDVRWTQSLLQDRKERLMISGIGLDRLAMMAPTHR